MNVRFASSALAARFAARMAGQAETKLPLYGPAALPTQDDDHRVIRLDRVDRQQPFVPPKEVLWFA